MNSPKEGKIARKWRKKTAKEAPDNLSLWYEGFCMIFPGPGSGDTNVTSKHPNSLLPNSLLQTDKTVGDREEAAFRFGVHLCTNHGEKGGMAWEPAGLEL